MHGVWVLGLPTLTLPNIKERQFVTEYTYKIYLGYNVPLISIDNGSWSSGSLYYAITSQRAT